MKSNVRKLWKRAYEIEKELYQAFSESGAQILWSQGDPFPQMRRDSRGRYVRPRYIHVIAALDADAQGPMRKISQKLDIAHKALHRAGEMVRYPSARAIHFLDFPVERVSVSISTAYKVMRVPSEGYFTIIRGYDDDFMMEMAILEKHGIRSRVCGHSLQILAEDINPDGNMNMRKVSGKRYLAAAYIDGKVKTRATVGWWILPATAPVYDVHDCNPGKWPVETYELPIVTPWEFRYIQSSSGGNREMLVHSASR